MCLLIREHLKKIKKISSFLYLCIIASPWTQILLSQYSQPQQDCPEWQQCLWSCQSRVHELCLWLKRLVIHSQTPWKEQGLMLFRRNDGAGTYWSVLRWRYVEVTKVLGASLAACWPKNVLGASWGTSWPKANASRRKASILPKSISFTKCMCDVCEESCNVKSDHRENIRNCA